MFVIIAVTRNNKKNEELSVLAHAYNPCTWEDVTDVGGQLGICNETVLENQIEQKGKELYTSVVIHCILF